MGEKVSFNGTLRNVNLPTFSADYVRSRISWRDRLCASMVKWATKPMTPKQRARADKIVRAGFWLGQKFADFRVQERIGIVKEAFESRDYQAFLRGYLVRGLGPLDSFGRVYTVQQALNLLKYNGEAYVEKVLLRQMCLTQVLLDLADREAPAKERTGGQGKEQVTFADLSMTMRVEGKQPSPLNLQSKFLSGLTFSRLDLTGALFCTAWMPGCEFDQVVLSGADFFEAKLTGGRILLSDLTEVVFRRAQMPRTIQGCNIDGANLTEADDVLGSLTIPAECTFFDCTGYETVTPKTLGSLLACLQSEDPIRYPGAHELLRRYSSVQVGRMGKRTGRLVLSTSYPFRA